MARACALCQSPLNRDVAADLLQGLSQREIAKRYHAKKSTVAYHMLHHIAAPIRRMVQAEANLNADVVAVQPVVLEMRRLNLRVERAMSIAEAAEDWPTFLAAAAEQRRKTANSLRS